MSAAPPETTPPENAISERVPTLDGYGGVPRSATRAIEIIGAVLAALGIFVIGSVIVSALDPTIADPDADTSDGGALGLQAIFEIGLAVAAIGAATIANRHGIRDGLRRLGVRKPSGPVVSTFFIALGTYAASALLLSLLLQPEQKDIAESLGADSDSALWITILAGILIAPVTAFCEEIFFRGLLFGGIRQRLSLWPAAIASGVIFGALHLTAGDLAVALQLSILGVIFAWAYERSGSLWVPIALHLLNNTIAFITLVSG
jgi:membrane protease YdiL (CAAX protease family)